MSGDDLTAQSDSLRQEESSLRERLRELEDEIHTHLRPHAHAHMKQIDELEREIRRIILRLVAIEREQIDLNISRAL